MRPPLKVVASALTSDRVGERWRDSGTGPGACQDGWTLMAHSKEWTKSPLRSLGSNHVLLGGMMWPASEAAMSCSTVVGWSEIASAALPESTRAASASV